MISLPENVKKVLNESRNQQLKKPIKYKELDCTEFHKWKEPVLVEITEPRDQKITCPMCGRQHYLIWSKIQDNIKWAK